MSKSTVTIPAEILVDLLLDDRKVSEDEKKQLIMNVTQDINDFNAENEPWSIIDLESRFQDHLFDTVEI